jgi:hypothetical protein
MVINALSELEDEERPWCDLVFDITDTSSDETAIAFRASGTVPSGEIGFLARVPFTDWTPQQIGTTGDDMAIEIHWGKIWFCSIGAQTDRLLAVYEEWFGLPRTSAAVPGDIECTAVILGVDPQDLKKKKISLKLFFDSVAERMPESYAELFMNFDLRTARAWLQEKDPEYRKPLVDWLAGRYQ